MTYIFLILYSLFLYFHITILFKIFFLMQEICKKQFISILFLLLYISIMYTLLLLFCLIFHSVVFLVDRIALLFYTFNFTVIVVTLFLSILLYFLLLLLLYKCYSLPSLSRYFITYIIISSPSILCFPLSSFSSVPSFISIPFPSLPFLHFTTIPLHSYHTFFPLHSIHVPTIH